jgi:dienelactone hydrolase
LGIVAEIVLFHHILGLTEGITAMAEDLNQAGHRVATPDLFDGQRFDSIEAGAAYLDEIGIQAVVERGAAAAEPLASATVYCGVSLGVLPAQYLAQTSAGARGCIALEAFAPPTEFGAGWPTDVALQVHGMADDPFFAGEGDLETARSTVEAIDDPSRAELFVYPGEHHLFLDRSLDGYDAEAGSTVRERMLSFLGRIDTTSR